jgi:pimeloyl-ACP methyl ester carboxylesterase
VVRWLAEETRQPVVVLGISLGAMIALKAAAREGSGIKAVVAVSIDTDTPASDAAVLSFLQESGAGSAIRGTERRIRRLGTPPYTAPGPFQRRARLLADLGGIEHGKRFSELLRGLLLGLIRTYGWGGAMTALRNLSAVQRKLLPAVAKLNLFASWPRTAMPVHYVFGGGDPLVPPFLVQRVAEVMTSRDTMVTVPDAGHLVHFDQPVVVRSIILRAHSVP